MPCLQVITSLSYLLDLDLTYFVYTYPLRFRRHAETHPLQTFQSAFFKVDKSIYTHMFNQKLSSVLDDDEYS